MAATIDRDRRRLSVGVGSVPKSAGGRPIAKSESELIEAVNSLKKNFKTLVSIGSKTDKDGSSRASFREKDTEYEGTFLTEDEAAEYIHSKGIGYDCMKGNKPESPNQDSFNIIYIEGEWALYGVYDGHGPLGHSVSDVARDKLVSLFVNHPNRETDAPQAFREAFTQTQEYLTESEVTAVRKIDTMSSGTTCTMAYHDFRRHTITVAHVGDSRAVMGLKAGTKVDKVEDLTVDHKPELPEEKKRIEASNGRVIFDGYFNWRVFAKDGHYPGLNMSRALGDVLAHQRAGLTALPDVRVLELKNYAGKYKNLSLLICSDGVWEFIESAKAFDKIAGKTSVQDASKFLVSESFKLWMEDSNNEISDDITCIMVDVSLADFGSAA